MPLAPRRTARLVLRPARVRLTSRRLSRSTKLVEALGFVATGEHHGPRYRMRAFARTRAT